MPVYNVDLVLAESGLEAITGYDLEIALAPCRTEALAVSRDGPQLLIIMSGMKQKLVQSCFHAFQAEM
jgi:hypothetical protein